MRKSISVAVLFALLASSTSAEDNVTFSAAPTAKKAGDAVNISFTLSKAADVEVAILDGKGEVVRHLAAGLLSDTHTPPPPLKKGLAQDIAWDLKDDFGNAVSMDGLKVRIRSGAGVKMGRLLGSNPMSMGKVSGIATDGDGNAYLLSTSNGTGSFKQIVAINAKRDYVRTVLPFAADLPPDRVKPFARHDGAFRPRNRNGLGPEFYTPRQLTLLETADSKGLILTDGASIYRIAFDGGTVDGKFVHGRMWPKKKELRNRGRGPTHLKPSPDGKYLYLSGPFNVNGAKPAGDFPPGQIYRMEVGKETMQRFVKVETKGSFRQKYRAWGGKHISHPHNYTVEHGPIHDIAIDKDGNVLVCDQDNGRIAIYDVNGKEIGEIKVTCPDLIAIHPRTGEIYVLTKQIKGYWKFHKTLQKFSGTKDAKLVAKLDFGVDNAATPRMSLAAGKTPVLWMSDMSLGKKKKGLIRVEDKGTELVVLKEEKKSLGPRFSNCDKLAVDWKTDTVYFSNAWSAYYRFNGKTGEYLGRVPLAGGGVTDLTVSPNGYIFAQTGSKYSGPLGRYTRDFKPAPYKETGTHLLSKYIYGRYHGMGGYCEKGMGASRKGELYMNWMFGGWVRYAVSAWGADGKPINGGRGLVDANHAGQGVPAGLKTAVVSPVPGAGGGVQLDSKGRIYVGVGSHPKEYNAPTGFEKDRAFVSLTGSVVRFSPKGGRWGSPKEKPVRAVLKKGAPQPKKPIYFSKHGPKPEGALETANNNYYDGADKIYHGLAPMSGRHTDTGSFGNVAFCHCRVPRFDVDMYDRILIPNAVLNNVMVLDNEGNKLFEFGAYGNVDSQGAAGSKPVKGPDIPLGWPTGVGGSDDHIYVGDMLNRRVVRVDYTFQAEATVDLK